MKKVLAVLLTLALMSSVAILPASAALEGDLLGDSTFTSVLSFDEDAVSVGELVKDQTDYVSFDPHNYQASIVAEGGESGNALHWTSPAGTSNLSFGGIGFDLAKLGGPTDWSEGTDLVFWVDMSDMSADVEVGVTIQFGEYEYQASGLGVFVENKDKQWIKWAPAVAAWNRINLPEAYKGWVRISLEPTSWVIADTSTMNNKTGDFDLANVSGVFVSFSVKEGDLGKVALMDSIGFLSGGSGFTSPTTTTTTRATTTTKDGDTTPTGDATTAGDNSDSSSDNTLWIIIGVAAAVVVVGAVVAFVVIKKKKKS